MLRCVSVRLRSQAGLNLVLSAALALTSLSFTPPANTAICSRAYRVRR